MSCELWAAHQRLACQWEENKQSLPSECKLTIQSYTLRWLWIAQSSSGLPRLPPTTDRFSLSMWDPLSVCVYLCPIRHRIRMRARLRKRVRKRLCVCRLEQCKWEWERERKFTSKQAVAHCSSSTCFLARLISRRLLVRSSSATNGRPERKRRQIGWDNWLSNRVRSKYVCKI